MKTWTHFEEDSHRLPEGMKRIGYDADTQIYTFQDHDGKLYKGEPGADYGILTPVEPNAFESTRTGAFDSGELRNESNASQGRAISTFQDILPATSITSTKSLVDKPVLSSLTSSEGRRSAARSRFVEAVRKSTVPKMYGVVHELRRSITTGRSEPHPIADMEKLLSPASGGLSRTMTTNRSDPSDIEKFLNQGSRDLNRSDTARSGVSIDTPTLVK